MCVIVVQEGKFPGWDIMKNCWDKNPDGAGYMFQIDGQVHLSKGYMSFETLKRSVMASVPDYKHATIVYHFRIATHGTVTPNNTHPYPYSNVVEHMRALELRCGLGVAHNGMISKIDAASQRKEDISDTAQFILEHYKEDIKLSSIIKAFQRETERSRSRFAILTGTKVFTSGKFYNIAGCKFSNFYSHTPTITYPKSQVSYQTLPWEAYGFYDKKPGYADKREDDEE